MLIGIIGAPNKGKSTLFSAMTMNDVDIADYPFTTIKPNKGIAYATRKCVHDELHIKCDPKNPQCKNGTRILPINITDVAGLVEGASEGKGMGNQFLNDLSIADCLIIVTDASGKTDAQGNKAENADPVQDVKMVQNEINKWTSGIIERNKKTEEIFKEKPMIIAANKFDVPGSDKNIETLKKAFGPDKVIGCSGAMELALRKAARIGAIDYTTGARDFKWLHENESEERKKALKHMQDFVKTKGTNVQELLNKAVFELLQLIVVYPVEDENKYTDHSGNVLPDAILIKKGSTAIDLAAAIHTDLASSMLYAIDARKKMRIAKEHVLNDNDIIRIVSAAKPK